MKPYSFWSAVVLISAACGPTPLTLPILPATRSVQWDTVGTGRLSYANGVAILIDTANKLGVAASLYADHDFMRADVTIVNQSNATITVDPKHVTAQAMRPTEHALGYYDPDALIASINRKADWGNAATAFAGGMARQTVTTTTQGQDGWWQSTTSIPDVAAQQSAQQTIATTNLTAATAGAMIRQAALRRNTVDAGHSVSGTFFFEQDRDREDTVIVRVLIEGIAFVFPFDPDKIARQP